MLDGKRRWAAKAGVRMEISAIVKGPWRTMPHSLAGEREENLTRAKKKPGSNPGINVYFVDPLAIHALDRTLPQAGFCAYMGALVIPINYPKRENSVNRYIKNVN